MKAKNDYSFYLFVQLRTLINPSELEYDLQFALDNILHEQFLNSDFNNAKETEYECIINFLKKLKTN